MYLLTIDSSAIPSDTPFELFAEDGFMSNGEIKVYLQGASFKQEWVGEGSPPNNFITGRTVEAAKVSPVEFKLLFTSSERVAINAILAEKTDPVLSDFYSILDDPRLTSVDMALESNQNAVGYALTVAGATQTPPYTGEVIVARRSEILSGVLK